MRVRSIKGVFHEEMAGPEYQAFLFNLNRILRSQHRTLAEFEKSNGFPVSGLYRLFEGQRICNILTLMRLRRCFNVPIEEFFKPIPEGEL